MFIEGGDIKLRALQSTDAFTISELLNNKKISDNLRDRVPYPYSSEDADHFLNIISKQDPVTTFAIEYKELFCGVIGLFLQEDVYRKSAEIGYWLGEPFWNKGIMTKAVDLICHYGFEHLDIVRIHTGIFEYNKTSMAVLEKNGFVKEGVSRKAVFKNGKLWDEHRYAKLKGNV